MDCAQQKKKFFSQLAPAEQILRLLDHLPDVSFFVKDTKGRFMAHSLNKFQDQDIKTEDDVIGKTDHDFYAASRADTYRADDEAVMASGIPMVNRLEPAPEPLGSPRLVTTSKIPLRDKEGKIIGVAGFSRTVQALDAGKDAVGCLAKVIEYLHRNITETLTSKELAKMAGLSISQFERRFRDTCGTSPRQYVLRVRVDASARKLIGTELTVSEIAQECGFHDHAHLSRSFRKILRQSPTEYRNSHRLAGST